jgi:hypothetical protein
MGLFDIELPNDTAICSQCGNTYGIHGWHTCWPIDKAVKEAIAARDKDWIAWFEGHYDTLCVIDCDAKDRGHGCIIIRADKWEARKKEINP